MKKLLLIPTLLTPTIIMPTCLTSCGNINDYRVADEEFRKIISFEGVKFLQVKGQSFYSTATYTDTYECSDTVFHHIQTTPSEPFYEQYVMKHSTVPYYTQISRTDPLGDFSDEEETEEHNFITPSFLGASLAEQYDEAIAETDFMFNIDKNCYSATYKAGRKEKNTIEFYFYKKQLVKYKLYEDYKLTTDSLCTYEQFTPTPPLPPRI